MDDKVRKRGWIKNVAIIFLSILLVLTFFSNTFMNRSLPEVAVQYVEGGTIQAQIRGTGTVTPTESYEVKSTQSRTVRSVAVQVGDQVKTGDALLYYAEGDSEDIKAAEEALDAATLAYQEALINSATGQYSEQKRDIERKREELNNAKAARDSCAFNQTAWNEANKALNDASTAVSEAQKTYDGIEAKIAELGDENTAPTKPEYAELKLQLDQAQAVLDAAKLAEQDAQARLDSQSAYKQEYDAAVEEVNTAEQALNDALFSFQKDAALDNLHLADQEKKIEELQAELNDLRGGGSANSTIMSEVNGIVAAVNVSAGNMAEADMTLMTIEVPDMGYSVSFSVTNEQSKRVRVGDTASVMYNWANNIDAILSSVRTDPANPTANKLLVFKVTGDGVSSGSQLTLSIGEKGQYYDSVVPNSSVRTDNNGSFVLAVTAKNTGLGTRYIATRVDVQVAAKDDVNSGVTGGLASGDYVITSSSKPIEPGTAVRLPD